jgi:hypothetical protein
LITITFLETHEDIFQDTISYLGDLSICSVATTSEEILLYLAETNKTNPAGFLKCAFS